MSNAVQDNTEYQLPSYDSCMKLDNYVTGKNTFVKNIKKLYYIYFE